MQGGAPIRVQVVASLTNLGVDAQYLKPTTVSFQSDKTICINDKTPQGQNQFTQIQVDNNFSVNRKGSKAEYSLAHPSLPNILCMRAPNPSGVGVIVQVYNLDNKEKLKNIELAEQILYMNWVNNNLLAMVTPTKVYHSDLQNQAPYTQAFERTGDLANQNIQIIGYKVQGNWGALIGIWSPDQKQINGEILLQKLDDGASQPLKGHYCCFGQARVHNDTHVSDLFAYYERKPGETAARIVLRELSTPPEGLNKYKGAAEYPFNPQLPDDFPIYMQFCPKYGQLNVLSKRGTFSLYELTTSSLIFQSRVTDQNIFLGSQDRKEDGIYGLAKNGNVILVQVDSNNLISHLTRQQQIPNVIQLAFKLAQRYRLPGADEMFVEQFNRFMMAGDYNNAAQIAASAPGELIRNAQTIGRFKSIQGTPSPLLVYFNNLIQKGSLNQLESLEISQLLLSQGKKTTFDKLLQENKLETSEALGDFVVTQDQLAALEIYKKANAALKVVSTLGALGRIDEANSYAQSRGLNMDYTQMIRSTVLTNPQQAVQLAKTMVATNPSTNVHQIAEIFGQAQKFKEMSAFLVDCMKQNRPEDGPWQSKVLEWNIINEPNIVDAIFDLTKWNQFNRAQIANLCERKQLFQRALENYSDIKDIRRVVLNAPVIPAPWLINYFGNLQPEYTLACMQDLLRHNRQNLQLVVEIASTNAQKLTIPNAIKCFEQVGSWDGIFMFLNKIIETTQDQDIHYKYIEAATKCNQLATVEQIIKTKPNCYDPVKVKNFLKGLKLPDPKALIFLCDIHKFIDELIVYLYQNNFLNYIQIYLFQVNIQSAPIVLGTLIDQECDERQIQVILQQLGAKLIPQSFGPLIEEFEKRNKLRVLENWLEGRSAEGNQIPVIHNALAKIKIDTNQDPEGFLTNNQFYDAKAVGKFCEERDPHLAVIAYKRAWGECDEELIMITNKNALFRLQARYLVERQSKELWAGVLTPDNPYRKQVIEQVVQSALPESKEVEQVSTAVKAFMDANLPEYLISLLEKIVLHNHEFGQYKKLQNLLIITAIKSDKSKVMDYINRLDNYDGPEIAKIALGEEYQLYEEAYIIFTKNNLPVQAVEVLLNNIEDLPRAAEYSQKVNNSEVWSKLAHAYLDKSLILEAIEAYIKAKDSSTYLQVISASEIDGKYEQLIKYLLMARETIKDANIDNSLVFAYARTSKLTDLENFISGPNSVDYPRVGDRCYDEKLYESAKLLFVATKNNAKIASCLVRLKQFQSAIDAAKRANTPKTWKELTMACVEAAEFKLAAVAGLNIIIHPDHLEELAQYYEEYGYQNEMISLLETGMGLDRAHVGIFTELGVLLAKYRPERLMEHCKQYTSKMNISKLLRVCERYQHWSEAVFLHQNYDQYDNAINVMIEHSPIAFNHDQFVNLLIKASNYDLYYKAILFYLDEQPEQLNELLRSLTTKIDLTKCVSVMKKTGYVGLIAPFLKSVQNANNKEVNETLNEIYLESYDYESLRQSISTYENFDQLTLAQTCERHQLLEFRRISAYVYRRIQKYEFSINLSKQDMIYRDAIETAQESGKSELVEDLLRFFVQKGEKEFITVTLYTAYDLIRPDLAMELAWRFNLFEFVMPYFIQITKELTSKVGNIQKKNEKREKEEEKKANQQLNQNMFIPTNEIIPTALMIGPPPSQISSFGIPPPAYQPPFGIPQNMGVPPMDQMGMGFPMGGMNSNAQFRPF